jgi:hypothetical protein
MAEPIGIRLKPGRCTAAVSANLPDNLLKDLHGITAAKKVEEDLFGDDLRLGKEIEVAELAVIPSDRVIINHMPKTSDDIYTAPATVLDDRAYLLVSEPDVSPVTSTVIDVIDHVRRLGTGRYLNEKAAPPRSVWIPNLLASYHQ